MKKELLSLSLLASVLAWPMAASAQEANKVLPITLSPQEVAALGHKLSQMPYYLSAEIIDFIQQKEAEANRAAIAPAPDQSPKP